MKTGEEDVDMVGEAVVCELGEVKSRFWLIAPLGRRLITPEEVD